MAAVKEFFRKFMVSLKRRPHNIPLVVLVVSFLVYSLNTSYISDTTAKLYGANMGFMGFVTMLFSILIFVVFLNAFPKREKPKYVMVAIMYVMFVVMIVCDIFYGRAIDKELLTFDPAQLETSPYIMKARSLVTTHAIMLIIDAALIALLPVYSKLLRKIKTSIEVEDNGQMGEIEVAED